MIHDGIKNKYVIIIRVIRITYFVSSDIKKYVIILSTYCYFTNRVVLGKWELNKYVLNEHISHIYLVPIF